MLYYMKTLQEWFGPAQWKSLPIAKTSAGYLQDFHMSSAILDYDATHIAICCLSLALQTYGVQVPLTDDFDEETVWYSVSYHNFPMALSYLVCLAFNISLSIALGIFQGFNKREALGNN